MSDTTEYVYVCTVVDASTNTCTEGGWVPYSPPLSAMLPTVDQANEVGLAIFISLVAIAAMRLLVPPTERDDP